MGGLISSLYERKGGKDFQGLNCYEKIKSYTIKIRLTVNDVYDLSQGLSFYPLLFLIGLDLKASVAFRMAISTGILSMLEAPRNPTASVWE